MKPTGKTSTFIIHHDSCEPAKWTPADVLTLASFVKTGNLGHAATLAKLGFQLVASEHLMPVGGTLQELGWSTEGNDTEDVFECISELMHVEDNDGVLPVMRVYRGPTEYAVAIPIGDDEGNFEGHECEILPTEAKARAYLVPEEVATP